MDYTKYFVMHANCIPVNGTICSAIYDLQRCQYELIPNDLYNIIQELKQKTIRQVIDNYGINNSETIIEYLKFLIDKDFGFIAENTEKLLFPNISIQWDAPSYITNTIIVLNNQLLDYYEKMTRLLNKLLCEHIFLVIEPDMSLTNLDYFLTNLDCSVVNSIQLLFQNPIIQNYCDKLLLNKRIEKIFVPYKNHNKTFSHSKKVISYSSTRLKPEIKQYLCLNLAFFMEAHFYNTYFNRKLFVAKNGEIRNAPETDYTIGNISVDSEDKIFNAIKNDKNFQKYWYVKKDDCQGCKNCQYRYMCIDNRIPKFTNNGWDFEVNCKLNPNV